MQGSKYYTRGSRTLWWLALAVVVAIFIGLITGCASRVHGTVYDRKVSPPTVSTWDSTDCALIKLVHHKSYKITKGVRTPFPYDSYDCVQWVRRHHVVTQPTKFWLCINAGPTNRTCRVVSYLDYQKYPVGSRY